MPRSDWLNPARVDYQARKWARDRAVLIARAEAAIRSAIVTTTDPTTQTDRIRFDPTSPDALFVTTSVSQPYGASALRLYPATLVRPDPVNPRVVYLTVTD